MTPQQVGGVVEVPRRTSKIFELLIEDGYQDNKIPPWFLRPGQEASRGRKRTSGPPAKPQNNLEPPPKNLTPSESSRDRVPLLDSRGQVIEDSQRSLEAGLRTSEASGGDLEYPGGAPELTPEQASYLQQRGIVQIPDGRWMRVTNH